MRNLEDLAAGLPEFEAEGLGEQARSAVASVWFDRAASERGAASVFASVAAHVLAMGDAVPPRVSWLAARAVSDELAHAEVCRTVAARYAGPAQSGAPWPKGRAPSGQRFAIPDPRLAHVCPIALQCCINETLGTAFLEQCLSEAAYELPRAAVRLLLRDELDHARIGWAVLASSPATAFLRPHVGALVEHARKAWFDRAQTIPQSLPPGHGCLSATAIEKMVNEAIETLVLPGFEHAFAQAPAC